MDLKSLMALGAELKRVGLDRPGTFDLVRPAQVPASADWVTALDPDRLLAVARQLPDNAGAEAFWAAYQTAAPAQTPNDR